MLNVINIMKRINKKHIKYSKKLLFVIDAG